MIDVPPDETITLGELLDRLVRLRKSLGNPKLRQLARASERIGEFCGPGFGHLPTLSVSAISAVFLRKRVGPPSRDWVHSLVLSCHITAHKTTEAKIENAAALLAEWDALFDSIAPDTHLPGLVLTERHYAEEYGTYLVLLLRRALKGERAAAYALGVVLCLAQKPREAEAWLLCAASKGHGSAANLLRAQQTCDDPAERLQQAAVHAFVLGDSADTLEIACLFLRLAARGEPSAAFSLAERFLRAGDRTQAAFWFNRAASEGLSQAESQFDAIHRDILHGRPDDACLLLTRLARTLTDE